VAPSSRRGTSRSSTRGGSATLDDFEEHIVDIDVGDEMRTSFL